MLGTFIVIISLVIAVGGQVIDDDVCAACKFDIEIGFHNFDKDYHREIVKMPTFQVEPLCESCMFGNKPRLSVQADAKICPVIHPNGMATTVIPFLMDTLTIICNCSFSANPMTLLQKIDTLAAGATGCPPSDQIEGVESLEGILEPQQPSVTDLARLPECLNFNTINALQLQTTYSGQLSGTWRNLKGQLTSRWNKTTGDDRSIHNAMITSTDVENIKTDCTGSPSFQAACRCALKANLIRTVFVRMLNVYFLCATKDKYTIAYKDAIRDFNCAGTVEDL